MLFVKREDKSGGKTTSQLRDELLKESKTGLLKNPGKSLKTAAKTAGSNEKSGYHVMQVKYNPSSIKFATQGGNHTHCGPGGNGINQVTQMSMPAQTVMTVELVFDDVTVSDDDHRGFFSTRHKANLFRLNDSRCHSVGIKRLKFSFKQIRHILTFLCKHTRIRSLT